jgi:hypothetical protein
MILSELTAGQVAAGLAELVRSRTGMERMATRRKAVELYQGVGLREDVEKLFSADLLKEITVDTLPVASKVIDARFSVYRGAPGRSFATDTDPDILGNMDRTLVNLERLTGLLGTEALIVTTNAEEGPTALHFVLATEFEPVFIGTDPEPLGVVYPLFTNLKAKPEEQEWEVWTDTVRFRLDGKGRLTMDVEDHGYGRMPVLFAHRTDQLGADWWRPTAQDVLDAQLTYNVLGTQHNAGLLFQALGQPVATGSMETDKLRMGVNQVVVLRDPQARFEMIAPPGNLQQIMDAQRWKMDALCFKYGIKAKWADAGGATSGEHQRLLEIELSNAVEADFARWRHFERDLNAVCMAVAQRHGVGTVGELQSVDFVEPNVPLSEGEKIARWKFEYDAGLATKADYYRMRNPDISDEDIAAILQAVADERMMDVTAAPVREPSLASLLAAPVA